MMLLRLHTLLLQGHRIQARPPPRATEHYPQEQSQQQQQQQHVHSTTVQRRRHSTSEHIAAGAASTQHNDSAYVRSTRATAANAARRSAGLTEQPVTVGDARNENGNASNNSSGVVTQQQQQQQHQRNSSGKEQGLAAEWGFTDSKVGLITYIIICIDIPHIALFSITASVPQQLLPCTLGNLARSAHTLYRSCMLLRVYHTVYASTTKYFEAGWSTRLTASALRVTFALCRSQKRCLHGDAGCAGLKHAAQLSRSEQTLLCAFKPSLSKLACRPQQQQQQLLLVIVLIIHLHRQQQYSSSSSSSSTARTLVLPLLVVQCISSQAQLVRTLSLRTVTLPTVTQETVIQCRYSDRCSELGALLTLLTLLHSLMYILQLVYKLLVAVV
jgi:hypothetical protein